MGEIEKTEFHKLKVKLRTKARELAQLQQSEILKRVCTVCGGEIALSKRSDAVTCSLVCSNKYRKHIYGQ